MWQPFSEPTATKPAVVATAAVATEPAGLLLAPFTQFFRSLDHHRATACCLPVPCLPTTR